MVGAAFHRSTAVFKRGEVDERRQLFPFWSYCWMLRIRGRLIHAFVQLLIDFLLLVLLGLEQGFEFLHVACNGICRIAEAQRNKIGIGHSHDSRACQLGKGTTIDKLGIGKMRVPVKIVIDRVINAASTFAAKSKVQGSHTCVIQKRRVIGSITQSPDAKLGRSTQIAAILGSARAGDTLQPSALPNSKLRFFWVVNFSTDIVDEALETMIARCAPEAAAIAV